MNEIQQKHKDIYFRCIVTENSFCDEMITDHMIAYIFSGEMILIKDSKRMVVRNGEAVFLKRNHLVKKIKQPAHDGKPFKGVFLHLNTTLLKEMSSEKATDPISTGDSLPSGTLQIPLTGHPFLETFFQSLDRYFNQEEYISDELLKIKLREAVLVLLQIKPALQSVLFDFLDPWKINLKNFMNENFMCNLTLQQFAHYTGRSLSSFKRDFAQMYKETPNRWIVNRRLDEAYSMLTKKKEIPSDVYLKVGFKNLSHFSTAFKKRFGVSPSFL